MVKKLTYAVIFAVLLVCTITQSSHATIGIDYVISFVSATEDADNAGLHGKEDWYQWLYKVEIIDGNKGNGQSHFTIDLENCFKLALLN